MRVLNTLKSLLTKRGYKIQDNHRAFSEECSSVSTVADCVVSGFRSDESTNSKIVAIVLSAATCPKLTVKIVRDLKKWCIDNNTKAIVACAKPPTPSAKDEVNQSDTPIQTFLFQHLQIDITEHALVPPHTQLSNADADHLLSEMFLRREQLPKLYTTDPVCRFYDFDLGSVVKIDRNNGHMLQTTFYRHVVHPS